MRPSAARPPGRAGWMAMLRGREPVLLEIFVAANLAFLVLDIYLAHSVNQFAHPAEWIPFWYSAAGALVVAVSLAASGGIRRGPGRAFGLAVGAAGILVGVAGLVFHLESRFFQELTLRSLVYSAPFVAPLSFAGLGFLLLLNRMIEPGSREWAAWVVFFAWAGFVGNFGLSLADHAQNGFFYLSEWIPVVMSALAVGYLGVILLRPPDRRFLRLGYVLMGAQAATGALGFVLHLRPVTGASPAGLMERIIYGAPPFAPLLFANLAVLAMLGLVAVDTRGLREEGVGDTRA